MRLPGKGTAFISFTEQNYDAIPEWIMQQAHKYLKPTIEEHFAHSRVDIMNGFGQQVIHVHYVPKDSVYKVILLVSGFLQFHGVVPRTGIDMDRYYYEVEEDDTFRPI